MRRYSGLAIGRYGVWVPILNRLLRGRARVVMTDVEWKTLEGGRVNRLAGAASAAVCVNTSEEARRYARAFRIDPAKFHVVPMTFQRRDLVAPATDEGFVLAGGTQGRDWKTFFDAVAGAPWPVEVYTNRPTPPPPSNVRVGFVGRAEFYARMAAAACVVVPVLPEPARITGTTSFITAMALGKPVVTTEPLGSPDYMEQGVSGFWVPYGDARALRGCLDLLMADPALRGRVARAARERSLRQCAPEAFRARVLALLGAPPRPGASPRGGGAPDQAP
jgi:hypothetical protein